MRLKTLIAQSGKAATYAVVCAVLLILSAGYARCGDVVYPGDFAISFDYLPHWAGGDSSSAGSEGEPDFNCLTLGARVQFVERFHLLGEIGFYTEHGGYRGPKLVPIRLEFQYDFLGRDSWRLFAGPHITSYYSVGDEDWRTSDGGENMIVLGIFLGGSVKVLPRFFLKGQVFLNAVGNEEWFYNPYGEPEVQKSRVDLTGLQFMLGAELALW